MWQNITMNIFQDNVSYLHTMNMCFSFPYTTFTRLYGNNFLELFSFKIEEEGGFILESEMKEPMNKVELIQ